LLLWEADLYRYDPIELEDLLEIEIVKTTRSQALLVCVRRFLTELSFVPLPFAIELERRELLRRIGDRR
jgi:hypothetical protein